MGAISGVHVEQPSSVYHKKPKIPLENKDKSYSSLPILKVKQPHAQTSNKPMSKEKEKEKQIIARIKNIANSLQNGFLNQTNEIKNACNSLDGTSKWTEREMELLNLATRIVSAVRKPYSSDVVRDLDNFAIIESTKHFGGKYFVYNEEDA